MIQLKVQENFANHMFNVSLDNISNYWFEIINNYDIGQESQKLNENLKLQGFDTALELAIDEIGFDGGDGEGDHPSFAFFIKGSYRIINVANNTVFYNGQLYYKSINHTLEEWAAEDSKLLQNEFNQGYHKLSSEILENSFLLFDVPADSLSNDDSCVLKPIYPILDFGFFDNKLRFVQVNSLQPELSWAAFPREIDKEKYGDQIKDVTYDLKILPVIAGSVGTVIYERIEIPEPHHKIDTSLISFSDYFWTVRARFMLNGQKRITNWSYSKHPNGISCLEKSIPSENYFRFKTP
ncbi:hypothetical protein A1353_14360 [Methylomonas methanica]|uniref:Uncharacterized protein n=1 Tax=Methylomonas methanica TaxID=421 RepID=A0A177MFB6_METMH|nr:hypothetical protein A1353_14360 [Methylomonas methanica]